MQVNGYVLIYRNNIVHLPLTSLRVIRGKSLLSLGVPAYATATSTPATRPTTTPSNYVVNDDSLNAVVRNASNVVKDAERKNHSSEDDQKDTWTTTSGGEDDERLSCSLVVASNVKVNSTTIGLKEIHLTSLHGQRDCSNNNSTRDCGLALHLQHVRDCNRCPSTHTRLSPAPVVRRSHVHVYVGSPHHWRGRETCVWEGQGLQTRTTRHPLADIDSPSALPQPQRSLVKQARRQRDIQILNM